MMTNQEIVETVIPVAVLQAMTPEAIEAIPPMLLHGENLVAIYAFPYRIGKESRLKETDGTLVRMDRLQSQETPPNNDLYLLDRSHPSQVSREHLRIEQHSNTYMLIDRGSSQGTRLIDGTTAKSAGGSSFVLQDGDTIGIGEEGTPFLYKFLSLAGLRVKVLSDKARSYS